MTVEYVTFPGWKTSIRECKTYAELPEGAKRYVEFVEEFIGVPFEWIGTGPARTDTLKKEVGNVKSMVNGMVNGVNGRV